eukprot:scaffold29509_cov19-Prasinocladus_malaysianus.AAC.1
MSWTVKLSLCSSIRQAIALINEVSRAVSTKAKMNANAYEHLTLRFHNCAPTEKTAQGNREKNPLLEIYIPDQSPEPALRRRGSA